MLNQFAERAGFALLLLTASITTVGLSIAANGSNSMAKQEFKVGDHLPVESAVTTTQPTTYQKLNLDDLIPAGWDPMQALKNLNLSMLEDSDPRAMEAMKQVRTVWDEAPVRHELNGMRVKIPGFVVPLDTALNNNVKEFLLVPYFGSCIHSPPPPSNQVVHVISPKILSKEQQQILMSAAIRYGAISVSGTLEIVSNKTSMAASGYRLKADSVAHYFYQGSLNNPQ